MIYLIDKTLEQFIVSKIARVTNQLRASGCSKFQVISINKVLIISYNFCSNRTNM